MKILVTTMLAFLLSCLPQVEGYSRTVEGQRLADEKKCALQFNIESTLPQISETAQRMKSECALSEEKVLELAKKAFN